MNFLKYNIKRGVSNMGDPVKRAARMKIFTFPVILIWRRGLRNLDLELIYMTISRGSNALEFLDFSKSDLTLRRK